MVRRQGTVLCLLLQIFDGWDKDFRNVTLNLTITAKWKKNTTPPTADIPISSNSRQGGMIMMKKLLVLLIALTMIITFAACGSDKQTEEAETATDVEAAESLDGGWEFTDHEAAALPEEVRTAFDKAVEQFTGSELKPVAYIASQVVAGTNHMILCQAETTTEEPVKSYQMAVVYADLEGNAELTSIKDFDLTAYTGGNNAEISADQLAGGWSVPEDAIGSEIPEDAQAAFNKAAEQFTGSDIEPLALLGTQVVAGTNYAFICKSTLTTQEPVSGIQIVTVYADLEGNAEITNISTLDPAEFNQ